MKNLANCNPSEFLTQTNRIRKSVSKWLTDTDIVNIRKRMPKIDENASDEERKKAYSKQASENINAVLDSILDEHPDETLELLALCCFVEPENVNDYKMSDYFSSLTELMGDEAVIGFFQSLASWANRLT